MTASGEGDDSPIYRDGLDNERLQHMANSFADTITLRLLQNLSLHPNDTLLDLGAGPTTGLGDRIIQEGAKYIALDSNSTSVTKHHEAGHESYLGVATDLPFENSSLSILNARFTMSWLGRKGREKSWDELLRVGKPDLRGVVTEYDWSVVEGPQEFLTLVATMRQALEDLGFESDYGRDVHMDIQRALKERRGNEAFWTGEVRESIPATTPAEKRVMIGLHVASITAALLNDGQIDLAEHLKSQLDAVIETDLADIKLPEVVSVLFGFMERRTKLILSVQKELGIVALRETSEPGNQVWRVAPSKEGHSLRKQARELWARIYMRAGYISPAGMTIEEFQNATDPQEILDRSDIFVATDPSGRAVSTVRLIHPNPEGIVSLPTGKKLVETYGSSLLPSNASAENVAEAASFASVSRNLVETMRIILAVMDTASKSGHRYVLFGAVEEGARQRFNELLGPAIKSLMHRDTAATITVKGPGYRPEGICLSAGYLDTSNFLANVLRYYAGRTDASSKQIINMCAALQPKGVYL